MLRSILAVSCLLILLFACNTKKLQSGSLYFTLLQGSESGITFNNQITESDSVHVFDNEYMYNGSGVGIGDFNNDGLPDVYLGGSMVSSRLYLNKGNMRFEDITENAGVGTGQWATGISVVDINSDGFQDIYVCSSHSHEGAKRKNLLFINDGKLHFTEQAAVYGLADTSFSTQAAFFDYDRDGDLDCYLLNHRLYDNTANNLMPKDTSGNAVAQDRLYRNEGVVAGGSHPVFKDVTLEAGIKEDGYGLGIVVSDVNCDGWPDVFAANDYIANDLLWLNNGNGTFSNRIATAMRHQSYNSMGTDAADINNDGLQDIASLDMMPEDNERKKMMFTVFSQEKYEMQLRMGYEPAFMRNVLQLNNGMRKVDGRTEPFFSEIGQLAGISETDWSWSILFADFDNDGWKDVHITNGLAKDVTNNDFTAFKNKRTAATVSYNFGGGSSRPDKQTIDILNKSLDDYGSVKVDNYFFRNNHQLGFDNLTAQTGLNNPSISNGAAYADLDNDGDLDLVVNNMNEEAFVYRNELRSAVSDTVHNFISVQLQGSVANRNGIGAKLFLYQKDSTQFLEQYPVRGFSSCVDQRLHFGLGKAPADSIKVVWPDGKQQVIIAPRTNVLLVVNYSAALDAIMPKAIAEAPLFAAWNGRGLLFTHAEMQFYDYGAQRGLLQKYSQLGPCMAAGDVNGDGLEDFFIGGAAMQSGKLFLQKGDGSFLGNDLVSAGKPEEDLGALFFDADKDGDLDLLVSGGSVEFPAGSPNNALRLYNNDGKGRFSRNDAALPPGISMIAKALAAADYDGDGDQDLFVGGYVVPQRYPQASPSMVLQNNGGRFTDVTGQVCPALKSVGLVTDAMWQDLDGDRKPDLVLCNEWMPIRFFQNKGGKLVETTAQAILATGNGMWRSLAAADLDGDGDTDFVAGNMGANNRYRVSAERPFQIFTKDVDKNGTIDIIPAYFQKDKDGAYQLFPAADRNQLADRFPAIKKKYLLHKDFASVTMNGLLTDYGREGWQELACNHMQTVWIENRGGGRFLEHALPVQAQFAPVNAILCFDADGDGKKDILLAGNEYEADAMIGRYDAGYGLLLQGNGKGAFTPMPYSRSGLALDGDVKDLLLVPTANKGRLLLAARNNHSLAVLKAGTSR
ncbi:VCBS repeat-containing protein [Cnuella takakiae]|nr:VCBS repeat-containing protein [Cnuella takakiae]